MHLFYAPISCLRWPVEKPTFRPEIQAYLKLSINAIFRLMRFLADSVKFQKVRATNPFETSMSSWVEHIWLYAPYRNVRQNSDAVFVCAY